jgi:hypothetical protein
MRLKKSFFDEDQKLKQQYVDESEAMLKAGSRLTDQIGEHGYVKQSSFKRD